MNRIDRNARIPSQTDAQPQASLRPASLAMAIGSILGAALPALAAAGDAGSAITVDTSASTGTGSTVSALGPQHWQVHSGSVRGSNGRQVAFNSFNNFGVEANQTVDLILPRDGGGNQVNSLVNLVWDSTAPSFINGTLNGLLADGSVGGRVYFVDPRGVLVGAQGVVNVGSLSIATPTRAVMEDISAGGSALTSLLGGALAAGQISADGQVRIDGTINASNGVQVQARSIDASGTILVAPRSGQTNPDFDLQALRAVNAAQPDNLTLVNDGGNIRLQAAQGASVQTGLASADARVTVSGTLQADTIELSATAVADSRWDDAAIGPELTSADVINTVLGRASDTPVGQIAFQRSDTRAQVEVAAGAQLLASKDIVLAARSQQIVDSAAAGKVYETETDPDTGKVKSHLLSAGALYGEVNADTAVIVRNGASLAAAGKLDLQARADTLVAVKAESQASGNTTAAITAAVSNINVDTAVTVERGAQLQATDLSMTAVNQSALSTQAVARADAQGKVGLAAAVSVQDIDARVQLDSDVSVTGNLVLDAASITSSNLTHALVDGPAEDGADETEVTDVDTGSSRLLEVLQEYAGEAFAGIADKLGAGAPSPAPAPAPAPSPGPAPAPAPAVFRLGAAMAFNLGSHAASATIGQNAQVQAGGDLVVNSQVVDAQIGTHALSNVAAQGEDGSGSGSKIGISGAVSVSLLEHQASSLVSSGAQLRGAHVGVGADVRLPRDFSALGAARPDFSSFDAFKDSLTAAKDLVSDPSALFTTYGAAKASADSAAVGGVISYFSAANTASAKVASGARITATASDGQPWSVRLAGNDAMGRARSTGFGQAVAIAASTEVVSLHAAGDLGLSLDRVSVGDGGVAVGGSVGLIDYDDTAQALVEDGVEITSAADVGISAVNRETILSLALQSGQGGSIGVNGTMSYADIDSVTLAGLSNKARVQAGRLRVAAEEDLFVWSVAGAVTMSDQMSVGASVAVQNLDTDTRAWIGTVGSDAGNNGALVLDQLDVHATSAGMAGAVAVAGAVAKSKSTQQEQEEEQRRRDNPGFVDKLKTKADGKVSALEELADNALGEKAGVLSDMFNDAHEKLETGGGGSKQGISKPSYGLAVSGSGTVNLVNQKTAATVQGANVSARGNRVGVDVAALNQTLLMGISGAGALTIANSENSSGSAAVAGAVAFADIGNSTRAQLADSVIEDAGTLGVLAHSDSEQVNVGLGLAVDASSDQSSANSAAGSVTIGRAANQTSARIERSQVTGSGADASVLAANANRIANGAGGLAGGGKNSVGMTVTWADVADSTEAVINASQLRGVGQLELQALDASRIIAAAVAGGVSTQTDGAAGGATVVINQVGNTTAARIDGGSVIAAADGIEAYAGSGRLAQGDGCGSAAGVDYCGNDIALTADANADSTTGDVNGTQVQGLQRGNGDSSIIAVAGAVGVGGKAGGLAFAYNQIGNTHSVDVGNAQLDVASGAITLAAADNAQILSLAAGLAGSNGDFAGAGSGSYNQIGNTTAVRVGGDSTALSAGAISLDARDDSFIGSLAGAISASSGSAGGAALTINRVGNSTLASVDNAQLDSTGAVSLSASNNAGILSAAIAAGLAAENALQGSFVWADIGNRAQAQLSHAGVDAAALQIAAVNHSRIHTLAGSVALGGNNAVGVAANVAMIADTTLASLGDSQLDVDGRVDVAAASDAVTKTLAIGGAVAGQVAVAGSASANVIDSTTQAQVLRINTDPLQGGQVGTLTVSADNRGAAHSLAGAIAGAGSTAVGAAVSINTVGGQTAATLRDAGLATTGQVSVNAASSTLINTLAAAGSGSGGASVAGSATTNFINTDTRATLADVGIDNAVAQVTVSAADARQINSLAGALAGGSAGVGVAVAVNQIGGTTQADVLGGSTGRALHVSALDVLATAGAPGNAANIRTVAAGLGGGASVGGAGSVAVNLMQGTVKAGVGDGADVVAERELNVLASQRQGIDVLAGSLAVGGAAAGIGVGAVVNLMTGSTEASITGGSTRASALGWNGGHGIAVAADTTQQVNTLGTSLAVTFAPIVGQSISAMADVNVIGSSTVARIDAAAINSHDLSHWYADASDDDGDLYSARALGSASQDVRVAASSDVSSTAYVIGAAAGAGGSAAGAAASTALQTRTQAQVSNARVQAKGEVLVDASGRQQADTVVAGLAGGLAGGAGSAVVNVFASQTEASLAGGSVRAQALDISAHNVSSSSIHAGAAAVGGAAMAGALVVNIADTQTAARLGSNAGRTQVQLDGALQVGARTDAGFDSVLVSGAGAGGVGLAGTAQFQQVTSVTEAEVRNAEVGAASVAVDALERLDINAASGAAAAGGSAGVGASANLALLGSKVAARVADSALRSGGAVSVHAAAERDIDLTTVTAGIGGSVGIGGSAGVLLSGMGDLGDVLGEVIGTKGAADELASGNKLDASLTGDALLAGTLSAQDIAALNAGSSRSLLGLGGRQDQVLAGISGGSVVAGSLDVQASNRLSASNLAGAVAAGGLGAGGAVAYSGLHGQTTAAIEQGNIQAGTVRVNAHSGGLGSDPASRVDAVAGAAGLVGLGAAVAVSELAQSTSASVSGAVSALGTAGSLQVHAGDDSRSEVSATGAAVGAAAVGVVLASAQRSAQVHAGLGAGANVRGFDQISLQALQGGGVQVQGIGASAGLAGAGNAVWVNAEDSSTVQAWLDDGASVLTVGRGDAGDGQGDGSLLEVKAAADGRVKASAIGAAVSAGAAVGAVVAQASAAARVDAALGNNVTLAGLGDIRVDASRGAQLGNADGVSASAVSGSGGIFMAVNGAVASASERSTVTARGGDNLRLGGGGDLEILASNTSAQNAQATGITAGGLALGATVANASSDTRTNALLGQNLAVDAAMGQLRVMASGNDANRAHSTAGTGGLISGSASVATTGGNSQVTALVGNNAGAGGAVRAADIVVQASHASGYGGRADSTSASLAGASGAAVHNNVVSHVDAGIGNGAVLWAGRGIAVRADNLFNSLHDGAAVDAAAGGVLNGSAALLDTRLGGSSQAWLGNNLQLRSGLDTAPDEFGNIDVVARTTARAVESAQLSTGGAIQGAVVDTLLRADFSNVVRVGSNNRLDSLGYLNLGTTTSGVLNSQALVNTWGLAAVGSADARVEANLVETVDVGSNTALSSLQNAYLSAGKDGTALTQTDLRVNAAAEGYVRGLVAVPLVTATATSNANMRASLGSGATLASAGDVYAGTWGDYLSRAASGRATGYQLGFIPVTVDNSHSGGSYSGVVDINGRITAGTVQSIDVGIGSGFDCAMDIGIGYACLSVAQLKALDASFNPGELVNDNDQVVLLDDIYAAGGDVHLHGTRIGGSGSVQANSAPSVDIVNQSGRHLAFGNIYIPDYAGGSIVVTGTADTGNLQLAPGSGSSDGHITIRSNQSVAGDSSRGTSILQMGLVKSLAADVYYESLKGSIITGPVYAKTFNTYAPNGTFLFNDRNANANVAGSAQGLWLGYMKQLLGGVYSDADSAAGLIANLVHGAGATSQADLDRALLQGAPDSTYGGTAIIVYGACLPHTSGNSCNKNQAGYSDYTLFPYNSDHKMWIPTVKYVAARSGTASYAQVAQELAAAEGIRAREVNITARYIDVNGTIEAGAGIDWSVMIPDSKGMRDWLAARDAKGGLHDVPASLLATGSNASSLIGVKYDATNRKFIVDDVNASGGGKVTLDGHIVSTSNAGRINVTSGFGQVRVDSQVDRDVQLGSMNVATGADGVVTIIDRLKTGANGAPYTAWYVQKAGQAAAGYDNRLCGSACTSWEQATAISNTAAYNPTAGMRFGWDMTARIKRTVNWNTDTASPWTFVNSGGGEASGAQRWQVSNGSYYQDASGGADFAWSYSGSFTGYTSKTIGYGCKNAGDCNFGFPVPTDGLQREHDWDETRNGGKGGWETSYRYRMPTSGQLSLNASVRADNPIQLNFISKDTGSIDVGVNSNLLLTGTLNNKAGTTTLESRNGSISQRNERAGLYAQDLVLKAAGDIGSIGGMAIDAALSNGGSLRATTAGGDIALDVHSDAHVLINAGNAQSGYGDVLLNAAGDITGLASNCASITAADITLSSSLGSIGGNAGAPLVIASHERLSANNQLVGGVVNASARHNIHLRDQAGDFWVGDIVAEHGDVSLDAATGSLLDAGLRSGTNALSDEQIDDIRKRLKLDGSGVADTVAAYERQVQARYAEYWNLQGLGQLVDGQWQATAAGIAAYRARAEAAAGAALDDLQVAGFVAGLYQQLDAAFTEAYGPQWASLAVFVQRDPGYSYTLDTRSDIYQSLARNAVWAEDQLRFAINAGALEPSAASVGSARASVRGNNVSLSAAGNIGRLADDVQIDYQQLFNGQLSQADALALALATVPGDVQLIGADGQVISLAQLQAMDPAQLQAGVIAGIRIKQTSPLFVQVDGELRARAGGAGYLYATQDLTVADAQFGSDARITVDGSLAGTNAPGTAAIATGGDLVLTVAGDLGSGLHGSAPQLLGLAVGGVLTGNAGGSAGLRQHGGDLSFNSLYVGDRLVVEVADGSLLSTDAQAVTVVAGNTVLQARDDIGAANGGLLNVRLAAGATLDGSAGGNLRIGSLDSDLHIGQLRSGGDITLQSATALQADSISAGGALAMQAGAALGVGQASSVADMQLRAAGTIDAAALDSGADLRIDSGADIALAQARASGAAQLAAAGDVSLAGNGMLEAASVDIEATHLVMANGARILAADSLDARLRGNARIGQIQVAGANGSGRLDLDAGGMLVGNGDAGVNLVSGRDVAVNLQAGTGIGQPGAALTVAGGRLAAHASGGGLHLRLPQGGQVDRIIADNGSVVLGAAGDLEAGRILASGQVLVDGEHIDINEVGSGGDSVIDASSALLLGSLVAGGDAQLHSRGAMALGQVRSGGALHASAAGVLGAQQLQSGTQMQLQSGDALLATSLYSGGELLADAGGDIVLGTVDGASAVTLQAAGDINAQDLRSGGDLLADAGGDIGLDTVDGASAVTLKAAGDINAQDLHSGGDLLADAGGDIVLGTVDGASAVTLEAAGDINAQDLRSGGELLADAGGDIVLGTVDGASAVTLQAAGDINAQDLHSGGELLADAGGDIVLGTVDGASAVTLQSAGDINAQDLHSGGELLADAGGDIGLDTVDGASAVTLKAAGDINAQDLHSGGDLLADAGGDIVVGTVDGASAVTLQAAGDINAQDLRSGGELLADAGGDIVLGTVDGASAVTLQAAGDINAQDLRSGGDLLADAGGDIVLGTVDGASAVTLQAAGDINAQDVRSGGELLADAGGDIVVGTVDGASAVTLQSAGDINAQDVRSGGELLADAGGDIVVGTVDGASAVTLQSAGDINAQDLRSGGDMQLHAGGGIALAQADSAADMQLQAGQGISVGQAVIGGDGNWQAGTDLQADSVVAGCSFNAQAGGEVAIGALQAGCNIGLDAQQALQLDTLQARGDIALRSRSSDVRANGLDAGGNLQVDAQAGIDIGQASSGGQGLFTAGTDVVLGSVSGGGLQSIIAGGSIAFDQVQSAGHVLMDAQGGDILGGQLHSSTAALSANQSLAVDQAVLGQQLALAADSIQANVAQAANADGPLTTTITGYQNGVARRVVVEVDARDAWLIDSLRAVHADLSTGNTRVAVGQGYIEQDMDLRTGQAHLWMDNTSPALRAVDVQLTELDHSFSLDIDGRYVQTDAYVVHFADGFRISSPNFNAGHDYDGGLYLGESAVRYSTRLLNLAGYWPGNPVVLPAADQEPVIALQPGAVNTGAQN